MTNITSLHSTAGFKAVDITEMKHAVRLALNENASTQALFNITQYLPSLVEKQARVLRRLIALETSVRENAVEVPIIADISSRALMQLQRDQDEAGADINELNDIAEDLAAAQIAFSSKLRDQTQQLKEAVTAVAENLDRLPTDGFLSAFDRDNQSINTQLEEIKLRITQLRADRDAVTAAINLIESPDFAGIANDILLTAQSLAQAGMSAGQASVVQNAISIITKLIGVVTDGFNLLGLIEQRDAMTRRLTNQISQARQLESRLLTNTQSAGLIGHAYRFDDHRRQVHSQANAIVEAFETVIDLSKRLDSSNREEFKELMLSLRRLADFARNLA